MTRFFIRFLEETKHGTIYIETTYTHSLDEFSASFIVGESFRSPGLPTLSNVIYHIRRKASMVLHMKS